MQFTKLAWFMALLTTLAAACVIAPYVYYVGPFGISNDHQAWSSFGSYIGGVLGPLLSFANLIAVAWIGVAVVSRQHEQLSRKQLTFDLLSEFHDEVMHKTRIALDALIKVAEQNSGILPSLTEFEKTDPTNAPHAFRLYHFFEKWAVLARTDNVDNDLLLDAIGARVGWWRERFFRRIAERESDPSICRSLADIEARILCRAR